MEFYKVYNYTLARHWSKSDFVELKILHILHYLFD